LFCAVSFTQPSSPFFDPQAFVARELSTDMDLDLYNQMLAVQQLPGSSQYFPQVTAGASN
jgi:hypothetical protein